MDGRNVKSEDYWSQSRKFDDIFSNFEETDLWEDPGQMVGAYSSYGVGSIESEIASGGRGSSDVRTSAFVGGRAVSSEPQQEKVTKLMAELKLINRKYQDRFAPMPAETVRSIMFGRPYSLECYKSLADKTSLLDEAIYSGDGNAILAAVLHLKRTVKKSILVKALTSRPVAAQHLLHYMKQRAEKTEVLSLLAALGMKEDAAVWQYKLAVEQEPPDARIRGLRTVLKDSNLAESEASLVKEHLELLERVQVPVDAADRSGNVRTLDTTSKGAVPRLLATSLQDTVYYCAFFHWGVGENHLACPAVLKKMFSLSEKQWHWPVLKALVDRQQWVPIFETFIVKKSMLRSSRLKGDVPVKQMLALLRSAGAPDSLINAVVAASPGADA